MANESKRFVEEFANPHAWLMTADNLHEQAAKIYAARGLSTITTKVNASQEIIQQTRGIDKSVFLLGGFALENAIKAFLVYENPAWISNGRLSGHLKSHRLTALQKRSKLIPYKNRHVEVLRAFESGLDSWFRYPCALTIEATKDEGPLFGDLWDGYCKVMRAYGRKLARMLGGGWNGPHGTYGRWMIQGQFLGTLLPAANHTIQHPSRRETHKGNVFRQFRRAF